MNIDSTWKGERRVNLRSLFTAILLMVVALAVTLGLTSTKTFAADNNTSIVPDKATEVILTSSATGDVNQPVTDADYAKLNAQYKVTPDGTPTIQSKTQNVENLTTKDGNKDKSYTKTTTKWVITDETKDVAPAGTQENPDVNVGPNVFAPITIKPSVPALLGGAVLGAVPALAAIPAAFVAGGVLPTLGALAAVPAAYEAGKAVRTLPALLTGAALNAIPAALTGAALNAIPAALTGAALNAIPAALTGAALTAIPARIALGNVGALHALANPLSFGGPIFRAVKGFVFPVPEIVKDHLEDLALAALGGAVPAALTTLALARLPLAAAGALHALNNPFSFGGPIFRMIKGSIFPLAEIVKDHIEDAVLAAIPALVAGTIAAIAVPLALLNGAIAAVAVPAALINGLKALVRGAIAAIAVPLALLNGAIAAIAVPLALLNGAIAAIAVPLALLNGALLAGTLAALPLLLATAWALGHLVPLALLGATLATLPLLLLGAWALGHVVPVLLGLGALALGLPLAWALGHLVPLALLAGTLAALPLLLLGAWALGHVVPVLLGLGALALGLPLAWALGHLVPLALLGLALGALPLAFGLGALTAALLKALADLALLGLLLNPLTNPFLGTGVISWVLRGLRTLAVCLVAAVDALLTLVLPAIAGLLVGVVMALIPGLNLLGIAIAIGSLGVLLTGVLAPLAAAIVLVLFDAIIQILKAVVRLAIVLKVALDVIVFTAATIPVALFAVVDGLWDSLKGALFALADPFPIGSALALGYIFLNMTEVYFGAALWITTTLVNLIAWTNLTLLEAAAIVD